MDYALTSSVNVLASQGLQGAQGATGQAGLNGLNGLNGAAGEINGSCCTEINQ